MSYTFQLSEEASATLAAMQRLTQLPNGWEFEFTDPPHYASSKGRISADIPTKLLQVFAPENQAVVELDVQDIMKTISDNSTGHLALLRLVRWRSVGFQVARIGTSTIRFEADDPRLVQQADFYIINEKGTITLALDVSTTRFVSLSQIQLVCYRFERFLEECYND